MVAHPAKLHTFHPEEVPMRLLSTVAIAALASALAAFAGPASAQVTAFEGARVIVGNDSAPIDNATLVIEGNRITQVGPAASVTVPAGANRVSLAGKTVMPMIIDTHVHLSA